MASKSSAAVVQQRWPACMHVVGGANVSQPASGAAHTCCSQLLCSYRSAQTVFLAGVYMLQTQFWCMLCKQQQPASVVDSSCLSGFTLSSTTSVCFLPCLQRLHDALPPLSLPRPLALPSPNNIQHDLRSFMSQTIPQANNCGGKHGDM